MTTLAALQAMKREGRKIVAVVAWDCPTAQIAERAGVELVSVGDSVGVNLWGRSDEKDVTVEEMALLCGAVRRGVRRALVSCDMPYGPLQQGADSAVRAARRLAEAGADLVKLDGAADHREAMRAVVQAGIAVFAQLEGGKPGLDSVGQAKRLEEAGAVMLDFKHSGPTAGEAVTRALAIPVLGGQGGGPWLDGRIRLVQRLIGTSVARVTMEALQEYAEDVRAGRQLRGPRPA